MVSTTGALSTARFSHTATLLPKGKVLVAGGFTGSTSLFNAELYDPATGMWSETGSLSTARFDHTATVLPNGEVLVAGGSGNGVFLSSAELYNPATNTWSGTGVLSAARYGHTATLLPSRKVLAAGGSNGTGSYLAGAELYEVGLGYSRAWQPVLSATTSPLALGQILAATGSGWRGYGYAEASGIATNNSASNYPLVQLYRLDNAQTAWLATTVFSATALSTLPIDGYAPGGYILNLSDKELRFVVYISD